MPPIGMLMGKMDFAKLSFILQKESTDAAGNKVAEVAVKYGTFINTVLDFVIVAFVMFIIVKQMNRLKRQQEPAPVTTKDCPQCISSIPLKATRCAHCTATL